MSRYSYDRGARFISIGPAIAANQPFVNSNTTPKNNGTGTGAGDEAATPATATGHRLIPALSWDYRISGGTLTALTIVLEVSDDGVNFNTLDTGTNVNGELRIVANVPFLYFRLNITTFTVNTGSPVLTGSISF